MDRKDNKRKELPRESRIRPSSKITAIGGHSNQGRRQTVGGRVMHRVSRGSRSTSKEGTPPLSFTEERTRKASYSPFSSFSQKYAISRPGSEGDRRESLELGRGSHIHSVLKIGERKKSIPVGDLTSNDVAICFYSEADWEEDKDEDDDRIIHFLGAEERQPFIDAGDLRERWTTRAMYLFAILLTTMSFDHIYLFPLMLYRFGALQFIIPYTIFTVILGFPLHFLESSLGQYSQYGVLKVWNATPLARGIGVSMLMLNIIMAYYYNMFGVYSIIYFSRSLNKLLPWQDCDPLLKTNYICVPRMCTKAGSNRFTPAEHYFYHHVVQMVPSNAILQAGLGKVMWPQVLALLFTWVVVYVAIVQGVKSISKVAVALFTTVYIILLMLLTVGLLLRGSRRGLEMLFSSDFSTLLDIQVWRLAAEQVFFQLGLCQGIPLTYASFCHYRNPVHQNSTLICMVNYGVSIVWALTVFLVLGALTSEVGTPRLDVMHYGPGMVFIVHMEAFTRVPGARLWCMAFFLLIFVVTVATQTAIMQVITTVIYDEFEGTIKYRQMINFAICGILFFLGITLCTSNGYFIMTLLYDMPGTMPRLPIAVCMLWTVVGLYGVGKYCEDMHFMLDFYPNLFIRACFYFTPFLLLMLTIASWCLFKPITPLGKPYKKKAIYGAWFFIGLVLVWIPLGAIYWFTYCCYIGKPKDCTKSLASWGPATLEAKIARAEFSSADKRDYTRAWAKRKSRYLKSRSNLSFVA